MSEPAYLFITFISALISVHMLIWVIDAFIQRPKRSRQVMKEGKWIKIDTSRGGFNQENVTSARGAALEFSSEIPRRELSSSRAGHVSLDYTSALQRKRRRDGLP
jgi:hypothetical protein